MGVDLGTKGIAQAFSAALCIEDRVGDIGPSHDHLRVEESAQLFRCRGNATNALRRSRERLRETRRAATAQEDISQLIELILARNQRIEIAQEFSGSRRGEVL